MSQVPNYIDLTADGPSHNQPPDSFQPAIARGPTTPLSDHYSDPLRPTPTTTDVLRHSEVPLRRSWSLVQSTWVPKALSHDNNEHPPDPGLRSKAPPVRRSPANDDSSTYVDLQSSTHETPPGEVIPTTSPTRSHTTTDYFAASNKRSRSCPGRPPEPTHQQPLPPTPPPINRTYCYDRSNIPFTDNDPRSASLLRDPTTNASRPRTSPSPSARRQTSTSECST